MTVFVQLLVNFVVRVRGVPVHLGCVSRHWVGAVVMVMIGPILSFTDEALVPFNVAFKL